jgi:MarR family transcriptional regulator, lower aerobic nicotinate degradation pathway regulator
MNASLLKELIDELQTYELHKTNEKASLAGFKQWWLQKGDAKLLVKKKKKNKYDDLETQVGRSLVLTYRYARLRIKVGLQDSGISSAEEFSFLATLVGEGPLSKQQLIEKNVVEKTTGFELIKRLSNQKLIIEVVNPNDGRSKIVKLTAKGEKIIYGAFAEMQTTSNVITEPLSTQEKLSLVQILDKLEAFHHPFYLEYNKIN